MYKTRIGGCVDGAKSQLGYVETDPSGRYARFREILGKGATKTVYRAFDEVLGMEVAWNQVKLNDIFRSPEELQRLYSEVHILKNLNHDCIIKFYTSWIDTDRRTFNFITEMFTSGTLREYRHKYQRVHIRAVKNWARQILHGLAHLHGHDPPIIHRDIKCDNIFVNGHLGQVKIGDLGLAAVLRGSQYAHSVIGTPEFMAPELYEEEYNELVDIYSFGMCVLEMLTSEYPYGECSNPAQIYKKVTSGKLPDAFYRIEDVEAREFVGRCLADASKRLPAKELLLDPFLAIDEHNVQHIPTPSVPFHMSTPSGVVAESVPSLLVDSTKSTDMTITGTMNHEDDTIFLKVQISDKDGPARNIYFPFDILDDTAIDVAMEMVKELEISDWEPLEIAEMIEEQISSLIPGWKESGTSQSQVHNRQQSFNYEDDENDENNDRAYHHPFYYSTSSHSSSQASLLAFNSAREVPTFSMSANHDRLQGELLMDDDDDDDDDDENSQSSLNSFKYSSPNYCSGNEDCESSSRGRGELLSFAKSHNFSRFCPADSPTPSGGKQKNLGRDYCGSVRSDEQKKLVRVQSMVNVRSQLLHKSLVEQLNRRRLFKTVGAVEDIGFHDPGLT